MNTNTEKTQVEKDAELIEKLGGPAKVADLLQYSDESGTQRVWNWTKRGIPEARMMYLKVVRPDVFQDQEKPNARKQSTQH
jgi:hypothetical protein